MKSKYIKLRHQKISKNVFKKKGTESLNFGLSILKVILSFLVVCVHNFNNKTTTNEYILNFTKERYLHVPSFFIMSFYFMSKHFLSIDFKMFIKRLIRLLIPYIIWPIFFWKLNQYLNRHYHMKLPDTYEVLKQQLLLANKYMHPLWFQLNLIAMTIAFFIIIFIFRKHSLFILQVLLLLSYYLQYSKYNYNNFFRRNPYYNVISIKSIPESIPFAVTGFTLGYYKVLDIIQKHKIKTFVLSYLTYKIIEDYNVLTPIRNVIYTGVKLNVQSICLIFIFSLFPSYLVTNNLIRKLLIILTNYTGGIYYLHVPIKMYLNYYSEDIKKGNFLGIIKTYVFIYFICAIGMLILGKTPFKYLFY